MLTRDGPLPVFNMSQECEFSYLVPGSLTSSHSVVLPDPRYPICAERVEVAGNVSLNIEPSDIDFLISELVVNEFSNATFSSLSVNSSLTLDRGSWLSHYPG
jgi:hypothetical protein